MTVPLYSFRSCGQLTTTDSDLLLCVEIAREPRRRRPSLVCEKMLRSRLVLDGNNGFAWLNASPPDAGVTVTFRNASAEDE